MTSMQNYNEVINRKTWKMHLQHEKHEQISFALINEILGIIKYDLSSWIILR